MNIQEISNIKEEAIKKIKESEDFATLNKNFEEALSKIKEILTGIKTLPKEKRASFGMAANEANKLIRQAYEQRKQEIKSASFQEKKFDITANFEGFEIGKYHPLYFLQRQIEEIFLSMGFVSVQGPHIETEWYNFDALNIPPTHPARDLWDTFWLKEIQNGRKLLMRTHTSSVQIRFMEKHKPPIRIISPGRVFRYEATDASHEINFYQVEGLMVDKIVSIAHFKAVINNFLNAFFGEKIQMRLRPSYFPFVEPGFEIDIKKKDGDWLEVMGAGLVHPKVLENVGINPKKWQGFAFGTGLDRLAVIKYGVEDVRLFYSGNLSFIEKFKL